MCVWGGGVDKGSAGGKVGGRGAAGKAAGQDQGWWRERKLERQARPRFCRTSSTILRNKDLILKAQENDNGPQTLPTDGN